MAASLETDSYVPLRDTEPGGQEEPEQHGQDKAKVKEQIRRAARALFVGVLNPRLSQFHKSALKLALSVVFMVLLMMVGVVVYTRHSSHVANTALVSVGSAHAIGGVDEALCETNTTSASVLTQLLQLPARSGAAPELGLWTGSKCILGQRGVLKVASRVAPATMNSKVDYTADLSERYASLYAAMMQGHPVFLEHLHQHCDNNMCRIGPRGSARSLEECYRSLPPGFDGFLWCPERESCTPVVDAQCCSRHLQRGPWSAYLPVREKIQVCLEYAPDIVKYRVGFSKMVAYAPALGLPKPDLNRDIICTKNGNGRRWHGCNLHFSDAFVNFTKAFHKKMRTTDWAFPCHLNNKTCNRDYSCFDRSRPICDDTITCEGAREATVSLKTIHRESVQGAIVQALCLSHYLELLATAFVVGIFMLVCVSSKDREELHLSNAELVKIVAGQKK